jgi:hypothetical protein
VKSRATPRFWAAYKALPPEIRKVAKKAYKLFANDPKHSSLRFKKVHTRDAVYAVRVTHGYRAVGLLDGDEIIWIWVGSHAEYDRLLKSL